MNSQKEKGSNYVEQAIEEMRALLNDGINSVEEAQRLMEGFLSEKLRESFKNGIKAGAKKTNESNGRNGREGYRGYRPKQYQKR
jgi:hypothetical protein